MFFKTTYLNCIQIQLKVLGSQNIVTTYLFVQVSPTGYCNIQRIPTMVSAKFSNKGTSQKFM